MLNIEKYWQERMLQRMNSYDEACRLLIILKGFFQEENIAMSLFEFANSKRPYGNKDIAASIAFNLGWDRDRVLCKHPMPNWLQIEAMKIHSLVLEKLKGQ